MAQINGLAEYIAQEEMERRNGFWWSFCGKYIAYTQTDTANVPSFRIMHQGKATVGGEAEEDHAYPFAGQPNVKVRVGVVGVDSGQTTWMDLECGGGEGGGEEEYLARVNWLPDGGLVAQVQNRAQTQLDVLKFDISTGKRQRLLKRSLKYKIY